jgi:hypothetical protein
MKMVEVKLTGKPLEQRLSDRLKNSGDEKNADIVTKHGEGARRTFHNIFHGGTAKSHGEDNKGEPGIDGRMRGPANSQGEIK